MTPTLPPDSPSPQYPRGEQAPIYRVVFQIWVVVFLLVICTSLLHYLGSWIQAMNR